MIWTYHGLFFGLGAIVMAIVYKRLSTKLRLAENSAAGQDIVYIFLAGLLGARLAHAIVFGVDSPLLALAFWQQGMISWGGIIFGLLAAYLLYRKRENPGLWFDALVVSAIPGWVVGRLGNFWQRDAFGVVSQQWEFFYNRVPVPLLEIIGLLIIWPIGLALLRIDPKPATTFWLVIALYSLVRLIVDKYRELPTLWLGLNLGQLTAVVVLCAIIMVCIIRNKHT